MRLLPFSVALGLAFALGCAGGEDEEAPTDTAEADADTDVDADTDADTDTRDTSPMDDTIELPPTPLPITVDIRGEGSATFDTIVCSHPPNNQLQLTYTDSSNAYAWSFRVFVRETFVGRGTYNTNVQVQLIENFSGGRYYATDSTSGSAEVVVEDFGVNGAYGTVTFSALTGDSGDAVITPQPVDFWCDAIDD